MAKGVSISPTTVRIPESLREALAVRASKMVALLTPRSS